MEPCQAKHSLDVTLSSELFARWLAVEVFDRWRHVLYRFVMFFKLKTSSFLPPILHFLFHPLSYFHSLSPPPPFSLSLHLHPLLSLSLSPSSRPLFNKLGYTIMFSLDSIIIIIIIYQHHYHRRRHRLRHLHRRHLSASFPRLITDLLPYKEHTY